MLKRFDKDGDGKLNDEERAEAHKAFEARRGAGSGNRGPRGDGAGRDRPDREQMRAAMLKRFDKDDDGKLSDEERAEARKQFESRRGGRGDRGFGGRGRGGPGRDENRDQPDRDVKSSDDAKSDAPKPDESKSSEAAPSRQEPGEQAPS